jgi:uncharacterized membrane protein
VNALDAALVLDGNTADEKAKDLNRKTFWKKITEIKVALLVSGAQNSRQDEAKTTYDLFGASYASTSSGVDKGTTIRRQIYLNQGEIEYEKYITRRFRFVMFVMLILTVTLAVLQIESNMFRLKIMSQTGVNLSQFSLLKRQRGASLIVSLLMLIVVLMLSISLAMVSLQGEKASRSDRDRQIALNAAEAALKDAEMDIDPQVVLANGRSNLFDATSNLFSKRDVHLAMVIFIKVCVQLP